MQLTFVGTGGGRFTMLDQLRRTGGMHLALDDTTAYIDPGPGALVYSRRMGLPLEDLDAVIATHAHLDHVGDLHAIIEAMTHGGDDRRGTVYAAASVLEGADVPDRYRDGEGTYGDRIAPVLDDYHRHLAADIVTLADGATTRLGDATLTCLETRHSDPRTVAFRLETADGTAGFVSDTELFDPLIDFVADCDALVVNAMRPHDHDWKGHLSIADVATLLQETRPDRAVLQHFGAALIYASVADELAWLRDRVDVPVTAADDGDTVQLFSDQGLERFTG